MLQDRDSYAAKQRKEKPTKTASTAVETPVQKPDGKAEKTEAVPSKKQPGKAPSVASLEPYPDEQEPNHPQPPETKPSQERDNCPDRLLDSNGLRFTWSGDCRNGKAVGIGKQTYPSGDTYVGRLVDGRRNGFGVAYGVATGRLAADGRYEGQFKNDKPDGKGIFSWYLTGRRYNGEWKDGKQDGHGDYTASDGSRYEGEWQNGMPNGQGLLISKTGNYYDGEWENGCFDDVDRQAWVYTTRQACGF